MKGSKKQNSKKQLKLFQQAKGSIGAKKKAQNRVANVKSADIYIPRTQNIREIAIHKNMQDPNNLQLSQRLKGKKNLKIQHQSHQQISDALYQSTKIPRRIDAGKQKQSQKINHQEIQQGKRVIKRINQKLKSRKEIKSEYNLKTPIRKKIGSNNLMNNLLKSNTSVEKSDKAKLGIIQKQEKRGNKLESSRQSREQINKTIEKTKLLLNKPFRYQKFAFRSEKYIRLSSELELQKRQNGTNEPEDEQDSQYMSYPEPLSSSLRITASDNNSKLYRLQNQVSEYKTKISRSENVLQIMQKVLDEEKGKVADQKKQYQQQIAKLKQKIQQRKLNLNLGHLFCYKDFDVAKLIPNDIIIERSECMASSSIDNSEMNSKILTQKGEQIMQYYQRLYQKSTQQDKQDNLSINSK